MNLESKILSGFMLAVAVLIFLGIFSYRNNAQMLVTSGTVTHTNEVLFAVEQVLVAALNMETGQRGFQLSGNEIFLKTYNDGKRIIPGYLLKVRELTKDNPGQQMRLDTLKGLIDHKIEGFVKKTEAGRILAASAAPAGGVVRSASGLALLMTERHAMDQIRSITSKIAAEENILLAKRIALNRQQQSQFNLTFISLLVFVALLLVGVFVVINSNLRARRAADLNLTTSRNLLRSSIESQKNMLIFSVDLNYNYLIVNSAYKQNRLNNDGVEVKPGMNVLDLIPAPGDREKAAINFGRALAGESYAITEESGGASRSYFETFYNPILDENHKIVGATAFSSNITERKEAEIKLLDVTEELRVANTELDAFSYSVSHDLRAPLRSINGFSRILREDYGPQLGKEGNATLDIIMNNARRMGQLIDDLLNFSRVGKMKLAINNLPMDEIARATVKEQQIAAESKKADVEIQNLQQSVGDAGMIKQVWTNLISNALKYSSKKDFPKIEIGSRIEDGNTLYYVKDNGVGFDMIYAHKLFGVFQRLHKTSEFEGTGVGLSLVSRIIHRHGGKVWAESKPGEGATFYFSLPIVTN